jgi:hypothetical protein
LIYPDKILAIRIGAAVLLGVFGTPLASLIALVETGPGEDSNCKALMASAQKPAKSEAKKNASPARR